MQKPPEDPKLVQEVHEESEKALREQDTQKLSKIYEDVLDEMHSHFTVVPTVSTSQLDERERFERELMGAMFVQVGEMIRSQGMKVVRVGKNGEGTGFLVIATDNARRHFEANVAYEAMLASDLSDDPNGFVRRCFGHIAEELITARHKYFDRMH